MKGFPGIKKYQDFRRKDVMNKGYILLNPITKHKAYIYDFTEIKELENKLNEGTISSSDKIKYFKRKFESEKQSINYVIQGTAALIFKLASISLFNWIIENNLFGIVKYCIPVHDEINLECPEHMCTEVSNKLKECMESAGAYFCKKVKLPVDITVGKHWIH